VRTVLARIALALFALGLSLFGVELVVRLALAPPARGNFTPVPPAIRAPSGFRGAPYVLAPGAVVTQGFGSDPRGRFDPGATLTYRVNAQGFRGPPALLPKPSGSFRVVGLGDSFTFGTGVREPDTYLAVLRRELGGPEVLNLGVMGYSTANEVALLAARGPALEPDLVLIGLVLNDIGDVRFHEAFAPTPEAELPGWRRRWRTADRVLLARESRRAFASLVARLEAGYAPDTPSWRRMQAALRRAAQLAEEQGFRLALVVWPLLWELSDGYRFSGIHRQIAEFAEGELGVPTLDLLPAFAGHQGPELWVHPANQHPNEVAHGIAGRAILGFLRDRGLVPGGIGGEAEAVPVPLTVR